MTAIGASVIDRARVEEIAEMDDAVMRNLYITQAYHDLARQMADLVGTSRDASWATFGCWASKTAGRFIRGQELPRVLQLTLKRHPELARHSEVIGNEADELVTGLSDMVLHPLRTSTAALARISTHTGLYIAEGNRSVFAELAASFADFIEAFHDDLGEERLDELLARYTDGDSEPDEFHIDHANETITGTPCGGQTLLKEMLRTLHRAACCADATEKAQLMLLASAYGGLHEQKRLQKYIVAALGTVIDDVFIPQLRSDAPPASETDGFLNRMILRVGRVVAALARRLAAEWSSRHMMTMPLPDETIRLGRDIRAEKGGPLYPEALTRLTEPELVEIIRRWCPSMSDNVFTRATALILRTTPGERPIVVGVAASNWGVYEQRMRLILAYFRTRQQCEALHYAPFTAQQLEALAAGEMPVGEL